MMKRVNKLLGGQVFSIQINFKFNHQQPLHLLRVQDLVKENQLLLHLNNLVLQDSKFLQVNNKCLMDLCSTYLKLMSKENLIVLLN